MKHRGWVETDSETDWDFFWADVQWISSEMDSFRFRPTQHVNHFRSYYEMCHKDQLIKNLKKFKRQLERDGNTAEAAHYDFFPQTFYLPQEYGLWREAFKNTQQQQVTWIMKPVRRPRLPGNPGLTFIYGLLGWEFGLHRQISRCQGQGIFLVNKLSQVADWRVDPRYHPSDDGSPPVEPYICQRYVDRPYLVGGRKFDLRLYCLVTSYAPLTAYIYRSGFARFTFNRFSMDPDSMADRFVHLTNVAIQKTSPDYDANNGCKWDLHSLKQYIISRHGMPAATGVMVNDKHCSELYGYDILLDADLKPWLLEVNASPSSPPTRPILDPLHVGGFDLVYSGRPVTNSRSALCPSPSACTTP
ncbi:putative tubulin tyrosine ligase [Paratrimastix pyriformis]|uniref:Tubulin--tyrosine ligase-like protein 9 n=1 Tax=Paratrimastix pyriformis TaxID=342808 RepID=A0ABQ8UR04_9EUKA|nr:putative tubulin tyrosine ligase [Paratrimastix pyriformis]